MVPSRAHPCQLTGMLGHWISDTVWIWSLWAELGTAAGKAADLPTRAQSQGLSLRIGLFQ